MPGHLAPRQTCDRAAEKRFLPEKERPLDTKERHVSIPIVRGISAGSDAHCSSKEDPMNNANNNNNSNNNNNNNANNNN